MGLAFSFSTVRNNRCPARKLSTIRSTSNASSLQVIPLPADPASRGGDQRGWKTSTSAGQRLRHVEPTAAAPNDDDLMPFRVRPALQLWRSRVGGSHARRELDADHRRRDYMYWPPLTE